MKVVTPKEMSLIEHHAFQEGESEEEFMEEAGSGVALVVHDYAEFHQTNKHIILLCGKGNNAGDAYVAGIHLLHLDYDVYAFQVGAVDEVSELCAKSRLRFFAEGGNGREVINIEDFALPDAGIIIDGFFGTGFHGRVEEPYESIIRAVNSSKLPVISVDIPSGLNGEDGSVGGEAICATETAFLTLPKLGFFLEEGWNYVGKLRFVDFGLPEEYIDESRSELMMLSPEIVKPLLPSIKHNRHKYEAGHVVALAGSPGMPGAAVLTSFAALRGGAGIVHLLHPEGMQAELAPSPAEIIRVPYKIEDLQPALDLLNHASGVLIGPGLGRSADKVELLKKVLPIIQKPCVIDADALSILAENDIALPKECVFTPHHGEMQKLLGLHEKPLLNREFLDICQKYAEKHNITLVLKGGPTFIFHPNEPIMVNPTGDPGMATAGSGDALTGLIAALLAQGLATHDAAALGVFLHGVAGEYAAEAKTSYCMVASDIIEYFPEAFYFLKH